MTFAAHIGLAGRSDLESLVWSRSRLYRIGCTEAELRAHLDAGRWQLVGQAVVLHNGALTRDEACDAAVINCGPHAVLTSFTALEVLGLNGWLRDEIHVLAQAGQPRPIGDLPVVLHRTRRPIECLPNRRCHPAAAAAVIAASSFRSPRPAVGLLAATVQQRITTPERLEAALNQTYRARHRGVMRSAIADIRMGADALSEIDFVQLCREHGLPEPTRQAVRIESTGRRRYLDAEWTLPDGRRVAVEVDGAVHLTARRWFDDQLRQNEIVLDGTVVLRFPSVVIRTEPALVARQLSRALGIHPSS